MVEESFVPDEKTFLERARGRIAGLSVTQRIGLSVAFLAFLAVIGGGLFLLHAGTGRFLQPRDYQETYRLVAEKVSKSAPVLVHLPNGMGLGIQEAQAHVTFDPALKGEWRAGPNAQTLAFYPSKSLEAGTYYNVTLSKNESTLSADFQADDDPAIEAIFPADQSEAHEESEITIVFNRPMVPLTTLDKAAEQNIPVEISPKTPGAFKWITTRNLQFIPEKRLQRSTTYNVEIKSGLVSMDGLPVEGKTQTFKTRPLRLEHTDGGITLYNKPIRVVFNQPVDIDWTSKEIEVAAARGNALAPILVSYGTRSVYDPKNDRSEDYIDKSVLEIYSAHDRFGREKFWDFNTSYVYTIKKVYPLEGDIIWEGQQRGQIQTTEIINQLSAQSDRSQFAAPDFFDPSGKLLVSFFEEVDKDRVRIDAKNLREVRYGEKCKEGEGEWVSYGSDCQKEEDRKTLVLVFNPSGLGKGEEIPVQFKKIVNKDGVELNAETITRTIRTYPGQVIAKVIPDNVSGADLTQMIICANTPLKPAEVENFKDIVRSNYTVGLWNWQPPFRVMPGMPDTPCGVGQFQNTIRYGLVPEFSYQISLNVEDDFGQRASRSVAFVSGKLDDAMRQIFSMQKGYNVTVPERTKLTYAAENLEYADLTICEIDAQHMLRFLEERPKPQTAPSSLPCASTIEKRIELPKRYWTRNYFQIDLKDYLSDPIGHYVVSLGHPQYRRYEYRWDPAAKKDTRVALERVYEHGLVSVTNLAVQEKRIQWNEYEEGFPDKQSRAYARAALAGPDKNLYWVTEIGNMNSVGGARVDVYGQKGERVGGGTTDSRGIARTSAAPNIAGAVVTRGADSAVVTENTDRLQWASSAYAAERAYLYTDRPIYRPGQDVFIKGIYRIGYDGSYEVNTETKKSLVVRSSKGEKVYDIPVTPNEYGTFTAQITLDTHAPLGTYWIEGPGGSGFFDVEEYVPAAFKVEARSDKGEYVAGDNMDITVDANYYFGVPLEEGSAVEYGLTSQDYYFDRYHDGYFSFGNGWYVDYNSQYGDRFLMRGTATVDANGQAHIRMPMDFKSLFKDEQDRKSKIFVFAITVKNRNGQSISSQKSLIVHAGEFYLGVNADPSFLGKGETLTARVKSVTTKGEPISIRNGTLEVVRITWESFRRREVDGRYYYTSEKKEEKVKEVSFATDSKGNAEQKLIMDREGEYELRVRATDGRDNNIRSTEHVYVHGPSQASVRPTNNETLDIATPKANLEVGERGSFVIQSPFKKAKALIGFERGKIFDYDIVDVDGNFFKYEFPVKEEYIPNIYATVMLLSPDPQIKYGQINYEIDTKEKQLNIEVKSNKSNYLPGEEVSLDVRVKDAQGRPVETELSLAVADLSVLALKGNPKKNPLVFFYSGMPLAVTTSSNIKNVLEESEIPTGTKGGGGGGEPEDLARKRRGVFKDTALWRGVLRTDGGGYAHVSFTLPDNLTTWQIETVGVTRDTRLGAAYGEFVARKDVMVVPLRPRFIIPGDEFMVGAQVFNQTSAQQRLHVSVESKTLDPGAAKSVSITLAPGVSQTVYFPLKAPQSMRDSSHTFTVSAKNSVYEDVVDQQIPITRNNTYESVVTAFSTSENTAREYLYLPDNIEKDRGGLTVNVSGTLAVFLSDALNYLVSYPYGCSEQIASKLSSIAIVKRGLGLKNVGDKFQLPDVEFEGAKYSLDDVIRIGLARIYQNQTTEGSFSYYANLQPDYYLTIHILHTLIDLKQAGYDVRTDVINKAAGYIFNRITQDALLNQHNDTVIAAAYELSRVPGFTDQNNRLAARVRSIASDEQYMNERASSEMLAYLAILGAKGYASGAQRSAFKTLESRIKIDGRGSYLSSQGSPNPFFYETPVKNTALLVKAYAANKRESPLMDKIIRWILRSRAKDGAWGSTPNTLAVVDVFTDYLSWKPETESDFMLTMNLNGQKKQEFSFDKDTILTTLTSFIPVSDIGFGSIRPLEFVKTNRNASALNTFYYDMLLQYFLPIDAIAPRDEGFSVTRALYRRDDEKGEHPLSEAQVGDVLRGHLTITTSAARNFVSIEDFIPAGMELVNFHLATEDQSLQNEKNRQFENAPADYYGSKPIFPDVPVPPLPIPMGSLPPFAPPPPPLLRLNRAVESTGYFAGLLDRIRGVVPPSVISLGGIKDLPDEAYGNRQNIHLALYPDAEEMHDDRLFLFEQNMAPGVYEYDYFVRALIPGAYHHLPAVVSEMYFPENFGRTRGEYFKILAQ